MYLTERDAKITAGLQGLGFDWSTVTSAIQPIMGIIAKKQQTDVATAQAKAAESQRKAAEAQAKVTAIAPGPGGATLSTQPPSVWQNKWTWVALGSGVALAGLIVLLSRKRR